mgnify:CR=1 FL=1
MINPFKEVSEFCDLSIDEKVKLPIAIVGAGGIVDGAHLPAYKKANLTVVGIFDTDPAKAKDVAARHGIGKVYSTLDELINDPASKVIDIAVPAAAQPEIFLKVAAAKKHILAQKPLATTVEKGEELAASAKAHGIVAGVNQQLRFEEGVAAASHCCATSAPTAHEPHHNPCRFRWCGNAVNKIGQSQYGECSRT